VCYRLTRCNRCVASTSSKRSRFSGDWFSVPALKKASRYSVPAICCPYKIEPIQDLENPMP